MVAEEVRQLSDRELLDRFRGARDEEAFTALVQRHASMVFGVCRRFVNDAADAEDCFQATFLALSQQAGSLRRADSVGSWLYGVALRISTRAVSSARRRRIREGKAAKADAVDALSEITVREAQSILHEELSRLPEKYRAPLVLCSLQGLTRDEAARQLQLPVSTLKSRLEEARTRLRHRLALRGLEVSGAAIAMTFIDGSAEAAVRRGLILSTAKAATSVLARGNAAGTVSARAAAYTQGVLKVMLSAKLKMAAVAFAAALLGVGLLVATQIGSPGSERPKAGPATAARDDRRAAPASAESGGKAGDERATRLALRAHAAAAAFDKLPRFSYRVKYRHGPVDSLRAVDTSLERLREGLTGPVLDKDWFGWYRHSFSWDQQRFLSEVQPGEERRLQRSSRFWTAGEAWERHEGSDQSLPVSYVRLAGHARLWEGLILFDFGYLRLTPHRFWWGASQWDARRGVLIDHTMSPVPPGQATWRHLGVEPFGGESCDVVESALMAQRLWIGQSSGRVRGVLSYRPGSPDGKPFYKAEAVRQIAGRDFVSQQEYLQWLRAGATGEQCRRLAAAGNEFHSPHFPAHAQVNELVRFDDYREIAPAVWLPFREVRTFPHGSETVRGKSKVIRSELCVEEARTDRDLSDEFARLLPKDGDRVHDLRFDVPVNFAYRASRTDEEIRKLADAEREKRREGQENMKRLLAPVAALVGREAPALPADGWLGGKRPDLSGRPYLLHFWATWCGPCKNDLPLLKTLCERGAKVVGMHPDGTPAETVEKFIRDQKLPYPTLIAQGKGGDAEAKIGGYPAIMFPYCVLVDAKGRVAGHGALAEVLETFGPDALIGQVTEPQKR